MINPQGCTPDDPTDCPYTRGTLPFNGHNSTGFNVNESSTWVYNGIFSLSAQAAQLGYTGNGLYGFDTVVLGNQSNALNLTHQVVAGMADKSYYMGQFGIGPKTVNFSTFNNPTENYMSNLVTEKKISSLSFGYTAGAAYRNKTPASLTLGGYDTNRFSPTDMTIAMNPDNSKPLQVGIQKITGDNTLQGTLTLSTTGTYHQIDSTTPHIWLPSDVTDNFVSAFGLTYDNNTDLFLINDTSRAALLQRQPTIAFSIGSSSQDGIGLAQTIAFPYGAFDLQVGYPFYENLTNYFPIRRAQNDTQYTIGRTFFQEAYVIADWERQNFTVAQTTFDNVDGQILVPILSIAETAARNQTTASPTPIPSPSLGTGAIAGIVVGVVVLLALISLGAFFLWRKKKRNTNPPHPTEAAYTDEKKSSDAGHRASELPPTKALSEMPSPPLKYPSEVDGGTAKWSKFGVQEMPSPPVGRESGRFELGGGGGDGGGDGFVAEAPESEGRRYELPGHEVEQHQK